MLDTEHDAPSSQCLVVLSFTAESTRSGRAGLALFLGRLRPSKRLTSTERGRPQQ